MQSSIFILGFSIFAMFFGSGNLVFPIQMGAACLDQWIVGFIGLFISGVLIPFAGVFAIKRYHGSYTAFFKELGVGAHLIIPLILLSLLGSFGVVPRCITVAFGGFHVLTDYIPLWVFGFYFCLICFFVGLRDTHMLSIIGKFMTPIKVLSLALVILVGVIGVSTLFPSTYSFKNSIELGLVQGYQTMDLIAGFFFSSLIFRHVERQCSADTPKKIIFWISAKASFIGACVIALAYAGLVYLGAGYQNILIGVHPTEMLPTLSLYLLGEYSTLVIAIAMGFSCLTTATALNNLYADFLHKLLKLKQEHFVYILVATTALSFLISLLNFQGITAFLVPILKGIYPGLIVFTLISLVYPKPHILKKISFYGITFLMVLWECF